MEIELLCEVSDTIYVYDEWDPDNGLTLDKVENQKDYYNDDSYIELEIDIIEYNPGREAPPPKNDIWMATPPEPEEIEFEVVKGRIRDDEKSVELTQKQVNDIVHYFSDYIIEEAMKYARESVFQVS